MEAALIIALVTVILTSPLLLEFGYTLLFLYQKKRQYPNLVAIHLTNGQWYFGRIGKISRTDILIKDIYYLNEAEDYNRDKQEPQHGVSLVKLGNELHGPEDFMLVNRQHIVFLENLRSTGPVAKAIKEHKRQGVIA